MCKKDVLLITLLAGTAVLIQGCVAAAVGAGAGTMAYIRGDLETVQAKQLDAVYKAAQKAAEQLELNITEKTKDAMTARIVARDAQDKKITIKLAATAENTTKLSIRVGWFGSETKSRLIYQKILDNL
jgi:hypothetical protein